MTRTSAPTTLAGIDQPACVPGRPAVLREYLRRYERTVAGFFSVGPDDGLAAFARIAARHPVFEVRELDA